MIGDPSRPTKNAAAKGARIAKKQGNKAKSLGSTTKVKFYTAKGKIKVGKYTTANGRVSFSSFKAKYGKCEEEL